MTAILDGLNEVIRSHGGHVVSVPGVWPVRLNVPQTQSERLVTLLHDAGWRPMPRGTTAQLDYSGLCDTLIYEISWPAEHGKK